MLPARTLAQLLARSSGEGGDTAGRITTDAVVAPCRAATRPLTPCWSGIPPRSRASLVSPGTPLCRPRPSGATPLPWDPGWGRQSTGIGPAVRDRRAVACPGICAHQGGPTGLPQGWLALGAERQSPCAMAQCNDLVESNRGLSVEVVPWHRIGTRDCFGGGAEKAVFPWKAVV